MGLLVRVPSVVREMRARVCRLGLLTPYVLPLDLLVALTLPPLWTTLLNKLVDRRLYFSLFVASKLFSFLSLLATPFLLLINLFSPPGASLRRKRCSRTVQVQFMAFSALADPRAGHVNPEARPAMAPTRTAYPLRTYASRCDSHPRRVLARRIKN